jgi:hypothetical protein
LQVTGTPTRPARTACLVFLAALTGAGLTRAQDIDACIGANEKALAQRKAGKLIDARASLSACAASSCPEVIRASCQQRLGEVSQAIPSIVFSVKDGAGNDLAAVKLTIDGVTRGDRLAGGAITLDPGEHEFRFEAAGLEPVVKRFVLPEGEQNRRQDIVLGTTPSAGPAPPAVAAEADRGAAPPGSTQRAVGLILGGVGVAGLALGGVFGALAISAHGSYEKSCGSNIGAPPGQCNATGVSGESDAATKGTISTIGFIAGGVLAAGGAVLFLTAPRREANAQIGVGAGSVYLRGRF